MKTFIKLLIFVLAAQFILLSPQMAGRLQAGQVTDDGGALFRQSYKPDSLKPGNVLQQMPYVIVCAIEEEDGQMQVMEYVGKGIANNDGNAVDINYWKVRHVDAKTGSPNGFDKYIRSFPQSDCSRPLNDAGIDFGSERPKDTAWAIGDSSAPIPKPDWNPLKVAEKYSKFSDVPDSNDYVLHIRELKDLGIAEGDENGNFQPAAFVTRAAFTKLIVEALQIPPGGNVSFVDSKEHWAQRWISAGIQSGIVNGVSETSFEPDALVRREEAAAMIWRYLQSKSFNDKSESVTLYSTKEDSLAYDKHLVMPKSLGQSKPLADNTDSWAVSGVKNIIGYGLYGADVGKSNDGGYFYHSLRPMTREEASALIHLTLNLISDNQAAEQ